MLPVRDTHIQLIDLPPVAEDYTPGWFAAALQPADGVMLVVDVSDPACVEQLAAVIDWLGSRRIYLRAKWPGTLSESEPDSDDPFRQDLPALLIANKCDLDPDPDEVAVLEELLDVRYPALSVSAKTGKGLDAVGEFLFENLGVVRIYTKTPGKPAETDKPFPLRQGDTVADVARLVHKDIAEGLRFARIWGASVYDGQQVGPEHRVEDGDVVELHMR
jgi:ribosome-interacting GTPase 1